MHYYQFNIGDYKSHTSHLDIFEDIAYRRLLDLYYQSETPIPKDIDQVSRLICMRSHNECITNVLREFFLETENGFINKRVDKEISAYKAKSDKAKASVTERWNKAKQNQLLNSDTNVLRPNNERNTKHKTININQEPLTNDNKAYAFVGQTIKLTESDYKKLIGLYPNIDLKKELQQLDIELINEKKWWSTMNAKLNYRNNSTNKPEQPKRRLPDLTGL